MPSDTAALLEAEEDGEEQLDSEEVPSATTVVEAEEEAEEEGEAEEGEEEGEEQLDSVAQPAPATNLKTPATTISSRRRTRPQPTCLELCNFIKKASRHLWYCKVLREKFPGCECQFCS